MNYVRGLQGRYTGRHRPARASGRDRRQAARLHSDGADASVAVLQARRLAGRSVGRERRPGRRFRRETSRRFLGRQHGTVHRLPRLQPRCPRGAAPAPDDADDAQHGTRAMSLHPVHVPTREELARDLQQAAPEGARHARARARGPRRIVFVVGLFVAPDRAWRAYHVNWLYFTVLSSAGVMFVAVQRITTARWSRPIIRLHGGVRRVPAGRVRAAADQRLPRQGPHLPVDARAAARRTRRCCTSTAAFLTRARARSRSR